jgi:starch-binding outer membrane protein, SusD/RagB family
MYMKKNKFILVKSFIAMLLIIAGTACQKLTEAPEGKLTPDNFYLTPEQCESAFAGSMNILYSTWGGYTHDGFFPNGQNAWPYTSLGYGPTTNNQFWQWHYKAITNINPVLKSIKEGKLSTYPEDVVADIAGQARFLRAFNYFILVRLYGKIPYIDEDTPDVVTNPLTPESRIEIAAMYDKIEADLVFAAANMYDMSTPGKPNKWTAKALLAKVYLTRATAPLMQTENYAKARDMADDVIVNSPYSLVPLCTDIFKTSNTNNSECMFAFQSSELYPAMPGVDNAPDEWGGWGDGAVKSLWADSYPEQPRKHIYLLTDWPVDLYDVTGDWVDYPNSSSGIPWCGKRCWPNLTVDQQLTDAGNSGIIMPILRLSDVYLMYAEAANMSAGGPTQLAVDRINAIIERANTPSVTEIPKTNIPGTEPLATMAMSKDEFDQKVIAERDYELCFEFDRYFDVLRKKMLKEVNLPDDANDYKETDYLLPIPPLDATHIGNNPGYE